MKGISRHALIQINIYKECVIALTKFFWEYMCFMFTLKHRDPSNLIYAYHRHAYYHALRGMNDIPQDIKGISVQPLYTYARQRIFHKSKLSKVFEPPQGKTNKMTYSPSED